MKSKFATTLALLGVLTAGTAAAAVNTQALQSNVETTVGSGTTTLITPTADATTVGGTATDQIQLDVSVAPTTDNQISTEPTTTKSASPKAKSSKAATAKKHKATSNSENEDGEDGEDEGDDEEDD